MTVDVVMPKMGESIVEGTVIEWRVKVGDTITRDEVLLEIATDKVDSEIPSPASGKITEILVQPQETVEVGTVIAHISATAVIASDMPKASKPKTATKSTAASAGAVEKVEQKTAATETTVDPLPVKDTPAAPPPVTPVPAAPLPVTDAPIAVPAAPPAGNGESPRRFYTPLVRTIAGKEGVTDAELATISGSGHGGRVNKADLLDYLSRRQSGGVPLPSVPTPSAVPAASMEQLIDEVVPMDRMRQRIAQHMRKSLDTSTHVYGITESDVTEMVAFRDRHKTGFLASEGIKLTYTPMIAYAAVRAIRDFPLMNARIEETNVVKQQHIHLGVAVALPDYNLIVAVIHHAEELNFLGLARQIADLAQRARQGELKPDEAAGSTFTITNPGLYGNLIGLPIINQPNVGILAVGTIKKRPVVWEQNGVDSIVIRSMMMMALGHDHRLIDGAYGAQFLERVVHYLQTINWEAVL